MAQPRTFAFLEAAAWVLAFVLGSAASVRAFSATPALGHHQPPQRALFAVQALPLPASFDPPVEPRHGLSAGGAAPVVAVVSAPVSAARIVVTPPPHRKKATPFHNITFAGYFPPMRHRAPAVVAMDPPPAPAPSPTAPPPRPRVHSLFGPLFGHSGHP